MYIYIYMPTMCIMNKPAFDRYSDVTSKLALEHIALRHNLIVCHMLELKDLISPQCNVAYTIS